MNLHAVALTPPAGVTVQLLTGLLWALVAASALLWGVLLLSTPTAAPVNIVAQTALPPVRDALTRLLGEPAANDEAAPLPPAASRFQLSGVIAPTRDGDMGIAMIAVDGLRVRTYRLGDTIEGGLRLNTIGQRRAVLQSDDGTAPIVLVLASPDDGLVQRAVPPTGTAAVNTPPPAAQNAAVRPAAPGADTGPPLAPAVGLVHEVTARPPGLSPNALTSGRRQRLRGLRQ